VVNTHHALEHLLPDLDPFLASDLRQAHGVLMHGLAWMPATSAPAPWMSCTATHLPCAPLPAENLPVHVEELLHFIETTTPRPSSPAVCSTSG
jgi:hypothetical protein